MGFFERKRHRREDMAMVRRVVEGDNAEQPWYHLPPWAWEGGVMMCMAVVLVLVCFWGRPPHLPMLVPGMVSNVRYEADFDFEYRSTHEQEQSWQRIQRDTPPVYRVATEETDGVVQQYRLLAEQVEKNLSELSALPKAEQQAACLKLIVDSKIPGLPERQADDLSLLVSVVNERAQLRHLLTESLSVLEVLLKNGVYEMPDGPGVYTLRSMDGRTALRNLRDNLDSVVSRELGLREGRNHLSDALFDIFRPGLTPNLRIDLRATETRQREALAQLGDAMVKVQAGDALLEAGMRVTPEVLERWSAYRKEVLHREHNQYGLTQALWENLLFALGVVFLVGLYARIAIPSTPRKRRNVSLLALLVLLNLLLIRGVLELGETASVLEFFGGRELLFWVAPPTFAAILVTMLAGPYLAVLAALVVSSFSAMMLGRNIDVLTISFFSCLVGIYFSMGVRNRNAVVRAGFFAGLAVAVPVFFICVYSGVPWTVALSQIAACLLSGLLTGIFAVGLLPLLENVFKITTDITLLELTDYNHPLLSKLQFIAPGTFHHSVMVANLAERAAAQIGANALLCRCAALFHDIGKMVKPEYFVENQLAGINPHADISPSMSALVIKSHVREGVEIAKEYKLPRVIIDIIEQHHGTGLIQFFYHKARQRLEEKAHSNGDDTAVRTGGEQVPAQMDERGVDENLFRYDGPRPRSKEAAIVLLADSIEAASRSLKKVTPQAIEELVGRLVFDRIADGQLDLSPLTFREVQRVKASLKFSLVNMLHHRVEYPEVVPENKNASKQTQHKIG